MSEPKSTNVALIIVLWAAGLGAAAQFGKVAVLFDTLGQIYTGYSIGWMVSVVGVVGLIFGTTSGLFVQRIGYRRVLVWALGAGAILSAFQATMPAFPLMMASRVLEGFSHLAIVVAGPVLIANSATTRHSGAAMSLWSSFFGVSFAITAWLGSMLVAIYGAPSLFIAHAIFMAMLAGILFKMVPFKPMPKNAEPLSLGKILHQHKQIYSSPVIAAPALGFVFYTGMYVALLTLMPTMFSGSERVFVATAMPLISIIVSLVLGVYMLTRLKAVSIVQIGFASALIASVALWMFWGTNLFSIVFALAVGGSLGLVQGASFASIPQLMPDHSDRASAAGALAQLGNLGTTLGTPILAMAITQAGISGITLFVVPLALGGILMTRWLASRRAA